MLFPLQPLESTRNCAIVLRFRAAPGFHTTHAAMVLSLIVAITFGVTSMHGILAIHAYVAISTVVVQHFVLKYHQKIEVLIRHSDLPEIAGFWAIWPLFTMLECHLPPLF
ncbi:hypothetical protein KIN20_004723 [Parelaphostrongylus tenuis]|uniref:Uncharacterized protein n=1 Tax=Parelaphostrongylus tenuis TaxID=148309 RepID=A0AAD5LYY8_PARTN|nr:hypothetical protein KIN20_004723 [Parelaphostrongylus tenuis]